MPGNSNMAFSVHVVIAKGQNSSEKLGYKPSVWAVMIPSDTRGSDHHGVPFSFQWSTMRNAKCCIESDGSGTWMYLDVGQQSASQTTHGQTHAARQTGVLEFWVLPFLRRCHQCWDLIIMVFPHRKAVQGLISTLRETEGHIKHLSNYDSGGRLHSAAL